MLLLFLPCNFCMSYGSMTHQAVTIVMSPNGGPMVLLFSFSQQSYSTMKLSLLNARLKASPGPLRVILRYSYFHHHYWSSERPRVYTSGASQEIQLPLKPKLQTITATGCTANVEKFIVQWDDGCSAGSSDPHVSDISLLRYSGPGFVGLVTLSGAFNR